MANLLSCATGNFLTAGTWALVASAGTSFLNSEANNTLLGTSSASGTSRASSGATTGAITIDGVALKIAARATSPSGTMTISLFIAGGAQVSGTTVTIDVADLPASAPAGMVVSNENGWFFFKFAAPVALSAATAYVIDAITSVTSQVTLYRDATAANWSRMLRTTTTQAPVAADDFVVAGEHTGQGTGNDIIVTVNVTAATDYGSAPTAANSLIAGCFVCKRGTLKWADGSAANPRLRLSNALVVTRGGTLNMGTAGTPIPRDSVAVLEFDCGADGDYGLITRDGGIRTAKGLSRTSGKNVVKCKLGADAPSAANIVATVAAVSSAMTLSSAAITFDPTGTSLGSFFNSGSTFGTANGTTATSAHFISKSGGSIAGNTTQVASFWIEAGIGTHSRFVRALVGDSASATPSNGFFADIDLLSGTIGTCTAIGNGTAVSATITAYGTGYICTLIGAVSSATATPRVILAACSAAGTVSFTGVANECWRFYNIQLYTGSSLPAPEISVDTDTGWLAGDVLIIASTSRTAADCEPVMLASDAGASILSLKMHPCLAHSGTAPINAEVINITRNVKIRGVSTTLPAYVNDKPLASIDVDWTEHYNIGDNIAPKRGIEVETTSSGAATAKSYQYSSIHDCEECGFTLSGTGSFSANLTFSHNVGWLCAMSSGPAWNITAALTLADWFFDDNTLIRTLFNTGWSLSDIGGTFTNNAVIGTFGVPVVYGEAAAFGTFSGIVAHSSTGGGYSFAAAQSGELGAHAAWRNGTSSGFGFLTGASDLTLTDLVAFGNTNSNITIAGGNSVTLKSPVLSGDTTFSTTNGITISGVTADLVIEGGDFSTVAGIKTAHTNDFNLAVAGDYRVTLRNTNLGGASEVVGYASLAKGGFVSSQKNDQTGGNHKTYLQGGIVQSDAVIYNTAAPSSRLTPGASPHSFTGVTTDTSTAVTISLVQVGWVPKVGDRVSGTGIPDGATLTAVDHMALTATLSAPATATGSRSITLLRKLESAPQFCGGKVAVDSGGTVNIAVYVRKSVVGDGAAYNGAQPRLLLKANPAIGVSADVVLDTMVAAAGTWEQLAATTGAATDDGVMEFVVDCDGTAGWVNHDDWTAA